MDWREKSLTLGNVEKRNFRSSLCEVTVTENRIFVRFKDSADWTEIQERFGESSILKVAHWRGVENIILDERSPFHTVILEVGGGEKIVFFRDREKADECYRYARKMWSAWNQDRSHPGTGYEYGGGEEQGESEEEGAREEDDMEDVVRDYFEG